MEGAAHCDGWGVGSLVFEGALEHVDFVFAYDDERGVTVLLSLDGMFMFKSRLIGVRVGYAALLGLLVGCYAGGVLSQHG